MTQIKKIEYSVGQRVQKIGGEYALTGTVVAAFAKLSGTIRYVVEADYPKGLLHIYGPSNLQAAPQSTGD